MSPIKNLSDEVRMPRLGKFHLGFRDPAKNGAPTKTDYFVLPKEHPDYKKLVEVLGEKPKMLDVLLPSEDEENWAPQYYKAYNQTHGLICRGDGEQSYRMVDVKTGKLPNKDTSTVKLKEHTCAGKDCSDYQAKKCHEVMNLRFILPSVPGLGVWQIDTGSKNSILNINSCAKIIRKAFKRISFIPLKLTLEPIEVHNPETFKKQTVFVLNLRTDVTMAELADVAREQDKTFLLEAPDMEALYEAEVEKEANELWEPRKEAEPKEEPEPPTEEAPPDDGTRGDETAKETVSAEEADRQLYGDDWNKPEGFPLGSQDKSLLPETEPPLEPEKPIEAQPQPVKDRSPNSILTIHELFKACHDDWKMQPKEVVTEAGYNYKEDITEKPYDIYLRIKEARG